MSSTLGTAPESTVYRLDRPHQDLLKYYILRSLILGPFFFLLLIPSFLRFRTLRYRFDDEGVSMRWGIVFRREITLTYARIQDIHLASNAIERALGLARVQVQTASGASAAEITVEGLKEYELVRDFLYSRMRGVPASAEPVVGDELSRVLQKVANELAGIRAELTSTTRSREEDS